MSDIFKPVEFEIPGKFVADFQGKLWFRSAEGEGKLRPKVQLRILNSVVDTIHPEDHPFIWSVVNSVVAKHHKPQVDFNNVEGFVFVFNDNYKLAFWRVAEQLMEFGEHAAIVWLKNELQGKGVDFV